MSNILHPFANLSMTSPEDPEVHQERTISRSRKSSSASTKGSINPGLLRSMSRTEPLKTEGDVVNVLFLGGGNIMFGSPEGAWNHSERLERKFGIRLRVVGIVDPWTERVQQVLAKKCAGFVKISYQDTKIFSTLDEAKAGLTAAEYPSFCLVGTPAFFRGTTIPGRDLEIQLMQKYPGVPCFIEKPVSSGGVEEAEKVAAAFASSGTINSIGYMMRYSKAVQVMKQIIQENDLTVTATVARYIASYENIAKPAWWMLSKDEGPIVEQGTHFVDLSRYLSGSEYVPGTVVANQVMHDTPAGKLSKVPVDESIIEPSDRIPRFTSASWQYENGAVGTMIHGLTLTGTEYNTEIIVYADGFQMRLCDPYGAPKLYVRRPGSDMEETHHFHGDDPFFNEINAFAEVIFNQDDSALADDVDGLEILSSFDDSVRTYELCWAIRRAAELNTRKIVPKKK